MTNTDRIQKSIVLKAPRARVWRALNNAAEFGQWFRLKLQGEFVAGKPIFGSVTFPGYEHLKIEMQIEKIEPERYFSYRWRPNATDSSFDYSAEPLTLVEFELAEAEGGSLLTITESGFDALPEGRRASAFRANEAGWGAQAKNIEQHVSAA